MRNSGVIPTDWKRGIVVSIWKGKGDIRECNKYRKVTLLSVPGKVCADCTEQGATAAALPPAP